jgi:hypothetical protein
VLALSLMRTIFSRTTTMVPHHMLVVTTTMEMMTMGLHHTPVVTTTMRTTTMMRTMQVAHPHTRTQITTE